MTIENALALIRQVCSVYRGTLQDHTLLQQALSCIEENLKKPSGKKAGEQEAESKE